MHFEIKPRIRSATALRCPSPWEPIRETTCYRKRSNGLQSATYRNTCCRFRVVSRCTEGLVEEYERIDWCAGTRGCQPGWWVGSKYEVLCTTIMADEKELETNLRTHDTTRKTITDMILLDIVSITIFTKFKSTRWKTKSRAKTTIRVSIKSFFLHPFQVYFACQ